MTDFERILEECLLDLERGASNLEGCLARHPEHVAQLKPILLTAARLEEGRALRPSPAFQARARARLTLHMQAHPRRKPASFPFSRLALSMAALLLALLATGTALTQSALPGNALYDWKLTSERAWRAAAPDKLEVDLDLLGRRADEMVAVAGEPALYAQALEGYQEALSRLPLQADAEAQTRILAVLASQQEKFTNAGVSIPELDTYLGELEQHAPKPSQLPVPTLVPTAAPAAIPTIPVPTKVIPTAPVPPPPIPTPPIPIPSVRP